MLRKTMVVLAVAVVLGGSALSSSAFARGGGYGGEGGLGGRGFRGDHFAGAFGDGRTVGNRYGGVRGPRPRLRRGVFRGSAPGRCGPPGGPFAAPLLPPPVLL